MKKKLAIERVEKEIIALNVLLTDPDCIKFLAKSEVRKTKEKLKISKLKLKILIYDRQR